jgi:hypothetical protein
MRELIEFDGAVECRAASGPIGLVLSGFECLPASGGVRHTAMALFGGANLPALPPLLHAVHLFALDPQPGEPEAQRFLLRCDELQLELQARSMQLHRESGREFFAAVPPPAVPWRMRLGWALLLRLLAFPGVGRLLTRGRPAS